MILEENPRSSSCKEPLEDTLRVQLDDSGMIKNYIVQNQMSAMTTNYWDKFLNAFEEFLHIKTIWLFVTVKMVTLSLNHVNFPLSIFCYLIMS